ncbi:2-amino-4-hydroxy-6-hydroxymethyldihydropteridinepyrophosphokinase [hydrothermal vent metagenome]|uniref:2-amino-4-hydroxy-6-hydroxymethyldihydropteridine diphosphokinase n=1 Tax=hydrothermal vent metagenome TaxID=652676 RepID=A0A3B0W2T7_9ZZZZ
MNIVYIGLGSNIKQPKLQIKNAMEALQKLPDTTVVADSGYFESKPMGPKDQPDYVNAVVKIETIINAIDLLEQCQLIETQQGRVKLHRWGERTIDLDILLYANEKIQTDMLTVPHPGISQRDFVYMPLLKINPDIEIPGIGLLSNFVGTEKSEIEKSAVDKSLIKKDSTNYSCQFVGNIERQ